MVLATLPLAAVACKGESPLDTVDLAASADLSVATTASGPDLSQAGFTPPPVDTCEIDHPPVIVALPPHFDTDGGVGGCVAGAVCPQAGCPSDYMVCCPIVGDGGMQLQCSYYCATGRRPDGLEPAAPAGGSVVGAYFADIAHLEAASVHAFSRLADELAAHGAPARLVRAARRAQRDEVRHARITARFARAHGGTPQPVKVAARAATRTLEELAVENTVEGCVRETFGALLATWQARVAGDGVVRRAMAGIAEDETRHAQLSWDIDAWVRPRLDREARARVAERRRQSVAHLGVEIRARRRAGARRARRPTRRRAVAPTVRRRPHALGLRSRPPTSALTTSTAMTSASRLVAVSHG